MNARLDLLRIPRKQRIPHEERELHEQRGEKETRALRARHPNS